MQLTREPSVPSCPQSELALDYITNPQFLFQGEVIQKLMIPPPSAARSSLSSQQGHPPSRGSGGQVIQVQSQSQDPNAGSWAHSPGHGAPPSAPALREHGT